jgi:hypothetical protein
MERIKSSETSAYKKQTPGNHPKENLQHYEHGESLKSRIIIILHYRIVDSQVANKRNNTAYKNKNEEQ